jgi:phage terminase large subunit-like protein
VLSGRIPVCRLIRLAVERHQRDLETGAARGLYFDRAAADRVIQFFKFCCHSKGELAGQAIQLEPWQQFIYWVAFGWKRKIDNLRRFRTIYIELPRKNGKSTMMSGTGIYMLVADGEPGAEVYAAATKKDQARIVHADAIKMRDASPSLRKRIQKFRDNLSIPETNSKFIPLGADEDTLDGLNTHCNIIDELHAHKTRKVWDVLETATGARRQPLQVAITTAGFDKHSICWEQHTYSEKILSQIIDDDTYFAFIACLDDDADWEDEQEWFKANPNLGISKKLDDMRRLALKAKEQPAALNSFLRLHLDRWTKQDVLWMPMDKWNACAAAVDGEELYGRECIGALDLASKTDLAALSLLFAPVDDDEPWKLLQYFWCPEENAELRSKKDRVPYDVWIRQGFIKATEGNVTDYDFIRRDIGDLAADYRIKEIAFDPWNATQLVTQLTGDGMEMVEFRQGFASMSAPTKELMAMVLGNKIAHGGNPVLDWMASNVTVRQDPAGNLKPDREKSTEKIDGIVTLIMAIGRAIVQPEDSGSVYDSRGVLTV